MQTYKVGSFTLKCDHILLNTLIILQLLTITIAFIFSNVIDYAYYDNYLSITLVLFFKFIYFLSYNVTWGAEELYIQKYKKSRNYKTETVKVNNELYIYI